LFVLTDENAFGYKYIYSNNETDSKGNVVIMFVCFCFDFLSMELIRQQSQSDRFTEGPQFQLL